MYQSDGFFGCESLCGSLDFMDFLDFLALVFVFPRDLSHELSFCPRDLLLGYDSHMLPPLALNACYQVETCRLDMAGTVPWHETSTVLSGDIFHGNTAR